MFIDPLLWSSKITPLRLFSPSCLVDGMTIGTANLLIGSIDKGSGDVVRYFSLAGGPQLCHGLSCYLRPNAIKDEESGIRVQPPGSACRNNGEAMYCLRRHDRLLPFPVRLASGNSCKREAMQAFNTNNFTLPHETHHTIPCIHTPRCMLWCALPDNNVQVSQVFYKILISLLNGMFFFIFYFIIIISFKIMSTLRSLSDSIQHTIKKKKSKYYTQTSVTQV